jgi:hypothetical protein
VFVDPVSERRRQPPGDPIQPVHRSAFLAARDEMLRRIEITGLRASRSGEAGSEAVSADQ